MRWIDAITKELLRVSDLQALEDTRRILLFMLLTAIGVSMLLIFGLVSLFSGRLLLASMLLPFALVGIINIVWLFRTRRYLESARVMAVIIAALCALLVTTGGAEGTGLLWVFPSMVVCIFTVGFRAGVGIFGIFYSVILMMLFLPETPLLRYQYPDPVKLRFAVTLLVLGVICLSVEFVYSHSRDKAAHLHSKVQLTALTDALTHLPNRRYVMEQLMRQGQLVPPYDAGCLVMADIDHFKSVNDRYGHDVGDLVLQAVAGLLGAETRSDDVVARWGGEEFLLVLPGMGQARAQTRMETVRRQIETMDVLCRGVKLRVTLSFGVTELVPGEPAQEALRRADEYLYQAKAQGRNQVISGPAIS